MIGNIWKKVLLIILIIACLFNIIRILVNRIPLLQELQGTLNYFYTKTNEVEENTVSWNQTMQNGVNENNNYAQNLTQNGQGIQTYNQQQNSQLQGQQDTQMVTSQQNGQQTQQMQQQTQQQQTQQQQTQQYSQGQTQTGTSTQLPFIQNGQLTQPGYLDQKYQESLRQNSNLLQQAREQMKQN